MCICTYDSAETVHKVLNGLRYAVNSVYLFILCILSIYIMSLCIIIRVQFHMDPNGHKELQA